MNYDPQNNGQQNNYNQQNYNNPQGNPYYYGQYHQAPQYDSTAKNMGTASLILGIIGVVFGGVLFGIVGLVLAIMAGNRGYKEGVRTAGLVLSIISIVYGILVTVLVSVYVFAILSLGTEYIKAFSMLF